MSNISTRSVDLLFAKRKVLAPRSVHDVLTERSRWPRLLDFDPQYARGRTLLYELAALKPTQAYTSDPRTCANTVIYLNVLLNVYDALHPIVNHMKTISSLSVWASPLTSQPSERNITPESIDEELFFAIYAVAAHLMFLVVDQSDYMQQQESVLKACIVMLNTSAHIWRTLQQFVDHNQHFGMFARHGGYENICFSTEVLFQLTRAQLCEMWVLYHRLFNTRASRAQEVQDMLFRTAMEYKGLETKLATAKNRADCILAGPFPPGALFHTAAIKHQYYLAETADQLIDRALETTNTVHGHESMALYIWRAAKEAGDAAIKRGRGADGATSLWLERMDIMTAGFAALHENHASIVATLREQNASSAVEASREQATQVTYTDLFGDTLTPLRQLETADTSEYNSPVFQQTATSLCATINECMIKLKRDLPAYAQFFDTQATIRTVSDELQSLVARHPNAEHETAVPTSDTLTPQEITEIFSERMHLWSALKRLGICTKRLAGYNSEHNSSMLLNLLNGQITSLIEMTQLIFYPHNPLAIDDLIELARHVSESTWAQLVLPRMRQFIVIARTNKQVELSINLLNDMQGKIRSDFMIYAAANSSSS